MVRAAQSDRSRRRRVGLADRRRVGGADRPARRDDRRFACDVPRLELSRVRAAHDLGRRPASRDDSRRALEQRAAPAHLRRVRTPGRRCRHRRRRAVRRAIEHAEKIDGARLAACAGERARSVALGRHVGRFRCGSDRTRNARLVPDAGATCRAGTGIPSCLPFR